MASQYFTYAGPTATNAWTAEWESRIRVGTEEGYGSLSVTGDLYTGVYDWASIGLQAGKATDLGVLAAAPTVEPTATFEEVEGGNIKSSGIFSLTEEGLIIGLAVKEWNPLVLEAALANGSMFTVGTTERLFEAGGACTIRNRPLEIAAFNIGCDAPAAQDASAGIQGFVLTVYGGYFSSGLNIGELNPREVSTIELEYTAIPLLTKALGNRLYNMLVY